MSDIITHCQICREELDDEERRSPATAGGWTMCDVCYDDDWSYQCGLCGGREPNDHPWLATVIGPQASTVGLTSGIYQVIRWPWLIDNMLSERVLDGSLVRVCDAPDWVDEGGEPLCRECAIKAIVRRTSSGRWRVTSTYWRRWSWHSKTRVYRTKALALVRARLYVCVRST